jgi:capsule polysaccharide export protein KpsE/RkpR
MTPTTDLDDVVTAPDAASERVQISAVSIVNLLLRKRSQLIRAAGVGLVISAILAFSIPPRYESVVRLMPPDQSNGGMGAAMMSMLTAKAGDSLGALAGDALNLKNSGALVISILTSDTVQDDIINRLDLRKVYWRKRYDDTRRILSKRTDISEDRKSGIIVIHVVDSNPRRARAIAQAYVDEANAKVSQLTTSSAHRERVFLEQRLAEVKEQLDIASLALSSFSSKNKTLDPETQGRAMLEAMATLQGQLIAAGAELKGVEQVYGPENSRVHAASAKVEELRTRLWQITGEGASSGQLQAGQLYPSIQQLPMLGNIYLDLYRKAKINEAVYEALTKQYELAKVEEAKEIPTIKVLDAPELPEGKSWPPRALFIVLGTLTFAVVGITIITAEITLANMAPHDPRRTGVQWFVRSMRHCIGDSERPHRTPARKRV